MVENRILKLVRTYSVWKCLFSRLEDNIQIKLYEGVAVNEVFEPVLDVATHKVCILTYQTTTQLPPLELCNCNMLGINSIVSFDARYASYA